MSEHDKQKQKSGLFRTFYVYLYCNIFVLPTSSQLLEIYHKTKVYLGLET